MPSSLALEAQVFVVVRFLVDVADCGFAQGCLAIRAAANLVNGKSSHELFCLCVFCKTGHFVSHDCPPHARVPLRRVELCPTRTAVCRVFSAVSLDALNEPVDGRLPDVKTLVFELQPIHATPARFVESVAASCALADVFRDARERFRARWLPKAKKKYLPLMTCVCVCVTMEKNSSSAKTWAGVSV